MRRLFTALTAAGTLLGWLQLAPAFGFPVTDAQAMLDRALGPRREEDWVGWLLLLVVLAAFGAIYLLVIEPRRPEAWTGLAYGATAWLLTGLVLMPLLEIIQGTPPAGDVSNDPMRATFFMSNLGPGAALEALIAWLLFGAVLTAGRSLTVAMPGLAAAVVIAIVAGVVAFWLPRWTDTWREGAAAEGTIAKLPAGPVFISVLELPQPAGAVLGPHQHVGGFVVDLSGSTVLRVPGDGSRKVSPGEVAFIPPLQPHSHDNLGPVPFAIGLAVLMVALLGAWIVRPMWHFGAALLVVAAIAAGNPFMNDWYFIGVRPAVARGAPMPVPAGHRVYESENLVGLANGGYTERVTERVLTGNQSIEVSGPAALVLVSGNASFRTDGGSEDLSSGFGITVTAGATGSLHAGTAGCEVLLIGLQPAGS